MHCLQLRRRRGGARDRRNEKTNAATRIHHIESGVCAETEHP